MWEMDHKEGWAPKKWCFHTVVLEKTLESPLDNKEIKPVQPKGNQSWIFIGRTDAEAEAPILWPPKWVEPTLWKRPWCWERLNSGREGDNRGWAGCMKSPIQWTWTWVNSGRWWGTGRPGMLQTMGSQRVIHNLVAEQQQQHTNMHFPGILILLETSALVAMQYSIQYVYHCFLNPSYLFGEISLSGVVCDAFFGTKSNFLRITSCNRNFFKAQILSAKMLFWKT